MFSPSFLADFLAQLNIIILPSEVVEKNECLFEKISDFCCVCLLDVL